MRSFVGEQMKINEVAIEHIKLDPRSRDEVPGVLYGLQYIYTNIELRTEVEAVLRKLIPDKVNTNFGRPGMELWKILVLGIVRLACNIDFDKLHDLANNHRKIREFLFHSPEDTSSYSLSAIRENIQLFTPEILDEINELVVKAGHDILKKKRIKRRKKSLKLKATLLL